VTFSVVHLFAGSGGCTLGFQRAGFCSLGSFDFDAKACRDLERLTTGRAFCRDLAAMQPAELRALTGACPDVVVMSPPCKSFSGCMPAARAGEERYVDMSQLAVRGIFLALEAWAPEVPRIILLENVPRIQTRGAPLLAQVVALLHHYGYTTDQRTHDCGELGGLAQRRERFLLVARHMERCPDVLRKPPPQRVRTVGEVLGQLPSPAAAHGDEMHRLPLLSALNWLRLAAIRAGKDWRDLPAAIRLGGDDQARHNGIYGVEDAAAPAHTVTANARPGATWGAVADPRVGWDPAAHGGRPDSFGVGSWSATSPTVRGRSDIQTSRGSVADPRLADRAARQNGGFGVEGFDAPAHAVLGEGSVRNTRVSVADPRLGCEPRNGHYGVIDGDEPSPTIIGHHQHDCAPASVADPRLSYRSAERVAQADRRQAGRGHSGRGDFGVLDPAAPAPTIRARHEVRQAPAAIVDARGWPVPTHQLVVGPDGSLTLYTLDGSGPPDLNSKRPCLMVIETFIDAPKAERGTWHRPLTDRELATLQGFPIDCKLEGPSSSSRSGAGRREHIGNAIPPPTAEAIAREVVATLRSTSVAGFLVGGDVWVQPEEVASV
jgi:site-specific DNA-cytosine methylase